MPTVPGEEVVDQNSKAIPYTVRMRPAWNKRPERGSGGRVEGKQEIGVSHPQKVSFHAQRGAALPSAQHRSPFQLPASSLLCEEKLLVGKNSSCI